MKIRREHIPRDDRPRPIARVRPTAPMGKLIASPRWQPEFDIPIGQANEIA